MTGLVGALAALLTRWRDRARTRRALAALPDRLLADVGLSRAQADAEAIKRPWQD